MSRVAVSPTPNPTPVAILALRVELVVVTAAVELAASSTSLVVLCVERLARLWTYVQVDMATLKVWRTER